MRNVLSIHNSWTFKVINQTQGIMIMAQSHEMFKKYISGILFPLGS